MQSMNFFGFRLVIFLYVCVLCIFRGSDLFCRVQCRIFRVYGLGQDECFFCFLFFPHQTCTQTHAHTRVNLDSYKLGSKQEKKENPLFLGLSPIQGLGLVSHTHSHTHSHTLCVQGSNFFFYFFSPDQICHTHVHVCTDRYVHAHTHIHTHTHANA